MPGQRKRVVQRGVKSHGDAVREPAATDSRSKRALAALAFGVAGSALAVWWLRQARSEHTPWPWLLFVAATLVAAGALRVLQVWLPGQPVAPTLAVAVPARRRAVGGMLVGMGLLLCAETARRLWEDVAHWEGTPALWLIAMALLLVGSVLIGAIGSGAPRAATANSIWAPTRIASWMEALAFALVLALALFLRVYRLEQIPPGIFVDETNGALDALYILEGRAAAPFGTGWYGVPNGYLYAMAGFFKVFGANWLSLKLLSIIPALLTVPAVYILGRSMFGSLVGLLAMFLMAISRWHLTMSRWGWVEVAPPLLQVLATIFLVRALRERRALDYALSGLLAGVSLYTYLSARLVPITLAAYVLAWIATDPSGVRASLRRSWIGFALAGAVGIAAVSPLAVTYLRIPTTFTTRVSEINVFREIRQQGSTEPLVKNLRDIAKFFHQAGDLQGRHNLPGEPMLDPMTGVAFGIGIVYSVLAWRDHRRQLLLLWLLIGLAGSYLSAHAESPHAFRTLNVVPAITLIAADCFASVSLALSRILRESRFQLRWPGIIWAPVALALLALTCAGLWESQVYFGPQASSISVRRGFSQTETRVARDAAAALMAGNDVYLSSDFYHFSQLRVLTFGIPDPSGEPASLNDPPYRLFFPESSLPIRDQGRDVLLLLDARFWGLRSFLGSFFPGASAELVEFEDGSPLYVRMTVESEALRQLQGLVQVLEFQDGTTAEAVVQGIGGKILGPSVTRAVWEGGLHLERSAEYEFRVEGDLRLFLDGSPANPNIFLSRGLHPLRAEWTRAAAGLPGVSWREPGAEFRLLPGNSLFRVDTASQGLLGTYWMNETWEGEPLFRQVTPFFLLAWPEGTIPSSKFSARFAGLIRIVQTGTYWFRVEADDGARLVIDGLTIGEGMVAGTPNGFEANVTLEAGEHPILIEYFQNGGGSALRLFWRLGDQPYVPVPPENLIPISS